MVFWSEIQHGDNISGGLKALPVLEVYNGTVVDKGPISNLVKPQPEAFAQLGSINEINSCLL